MQQLTHLKKKIKVECDFKEEKDKQKDSEGGKKPTDDTKKKEIKSKSVVDAKPQGGAGAGAAGGGASKKNPGKELDIMGSMFGSKDKKKGPSVPAPSTMRTIAAQPAELMEEDDVPFHPSHLESMKSSSKTSPSGKDGRGGGVLGGKRPLLETLPSLGGGGGKRAKKKRLSWADGQDKVLFSFFLLFLSCVACVTSFVQVVC